MEYFTFRNTAIMGLTQVGLIVIGILGAGMTVKWHRTYDVQPPQATTLVADSGHFALVVPTLWAAGALWLLWAGEDYEGSRYLMFLSGMILVAFLILGILCTVASPWFHLVGGDCGLESASVAFPFPGVPGNASSWMGLCSHGVVASGTPRG
jgi:hypothetical protein